MQQPQRSPRRRNQNLGKGASGTGNRPRFCFCVKAGGSGFDLLSTTNLVGAPSFAQFAKGGCGAARSMLLSRLACESGRPPGRKNRRRIGDRCGVSQLRGAVRQPLVQTPTKSPCFRHPCAIKHTNVPETNCACEIQLNGISGIWATEGRGREG